MADSPALARGANVGLQSERLTASVAWAVPAQLSNFACLLDSGGHIRSSADIIGPASAESGCGAVRILPSKAQEAVYGLDLGRVPQDISKVIFCVLVGETEKRKCGALGLNIILSTEAQAGARFELPDDEASEAAAIIGELYRRNATWKFRAVGQGFKGGADRLAAFIGSSPNDLRSALAASPPVRGAAPSPPPPSPSTTPQKPATVSSPPRQSPRAAPAPSPAPSRRAPAPPPATNESAAELFSCRGWVIGERGVQAIEERRGVAAFERELLDLRSDQHGGLWPGNFHHQPMTGERLPPKPRFISTVGRSLGGAGFPDLDEVVGLDVGSRSMEDVPEGARFFASGGMPPRLVAIDPVDGQAWWKAPWGQRWVPVGRCPRASALPPFASGAVGTDEGVFYGADDGLVHLLPEQRSEFKRLLLSGTPIGPPGIVAGTVLLPISSGQGMGLALRSSGGELRELPVTGSPGAAGPLGAPVVNADTGMAFWVGTGGFLVFEEGMEGASAVWRPWPQGVEGLPFLRPFRAPNGRFWAMCVEVAGGGAVHGRALACGMAAAGSREKHLLLGPYVSVGSHTFRGRNRHQEPWRGALEEINLGFDYEGRWLLPLLRLGNRETVVALVDGALPGGGGVREFVLREGDVSAREVTLAIHTDNGDLRLLAQGFRIATADDLEFFLDAERLCIHHFESNQCASWHISFSL